MGQTTSLAVPVVGPLKAMVDRMEGVAPRLDRQVRGMWRLIALNGNDTRMRKIVSQALSSPPPGAIVEECLSGLNLDFETRDLGKQKTELLLMLMPITQIVVIHFHGGTVPEGLSRVTTLAGFLYIHSALHEMCTAYALLKQKILPDPRRRSQVEDDEESCPICMDRKIDTVLSCSHGLCKVCEIEWLVGEGRGTCPMCRGKENENDDWVLNDSIISDGLECVDLRERIERIMRSLLSFLINIPTLNEAKPFFPDSLQGDGEDGYDGLLYWMKAQLAYLNDKHQESKWAKCPRCTTFTRIPPTCDDDMRLSCAGCRAIWTVGVLTGANATGEGTD